MHSWVILLLFEVEGSNCFFIYFKANSSIIERPALHAASVFYAWHTSKFIG